MLLNPWSMLSLILSLLLSQSAVAESVHQATCIRPKGNPTAPVAGIYLHGWFNANKKVDEGFYVDLEKSNRAQLQKLADELGISIAVPLAQGTVSIKSGVMRAWSPSQSEGSAKARLKAIEEASRKACGMELAVPRSLIGFSDGGFMARELAVQCAAQRPEYKTVVMAGAKARNGSAKNRANCAHLVAVRGIDDDSTNTCIARSGGKCVKSIPFSQTARDMIKSIGGHGEIWPSYSGGHVLPPNTDLAKIFDTQKPPATVATDKGKSPPEIQGTSSAEFMEDYTPANK